MNFPVFGVNGLEDGDSSPSGVRTISPTATDLALPRVHDGREAELAKAKGLVNLLMNGVKPELIKAMDARERKQEQLREWEGRVAALTASVASAKNVMLRTPGGQAALWQERNAALKVIEGQLAECREECDAAIEERDEAVRHLQELQGIAS